MKELGLWMLTFIGFTSLCGVFLWLERKQPFPATPLLWFGFLMLFLACAFGRVVFLLFAAWF